MSEPLYDFPCSDTFREHERWWQGEDLYSEPREHFPIEPPEQVDYLRGCIAYLQNRLTDLEKSTHTHSYKKRTNYSVEDVGKGTSTSTSTN